MRPAVDIKNLPLGNYLWLIGEKHKRGFGFAPEAEEYLYNNLPKLIEEKIIQSPHLYHIDWAKGVPDNLRNVEDKDLLFSSSDK